MRSEDDKDGGQADSMDGMGHGSGWKGWALMALCCLPMIAIALLLAFGLFGLR